MGTDVSSSALLSPAADGRLGYRSFFSVDQEAEPDAVAAAMAQLHSWLRGKSYDVDALEEDQQVPIGEGVTASIFRLQDRDGSATVRALVTEVRRRGETWKSELTVHAPGRSTKPASVLLDISGPIRPRTPRLAGLLTGALPARDSLAVLTDQPVKISTREVEELAEAVCDPARRGLLFVAGMTAALPYGEWYTYVAGLLRETTGLAASYFLDPAATKAFQQILGDTHAVAPGAVRTFLPGADPASELDALRHRILGTERIVRDSGRRLAIVLGRRAQEETLQAELPGKMKRIQRRVAEHVDQLLLQPLAQPTSEAGRLVEAEQLSAIDQAVPPGPDVRLAPTPANALERMVRQGKLVLRRVLGVEEPSEQDWERLTELALRGRGAAVAQRGVAEQLGRLRDELDAQEARERDLLSRLQDEQLEHASTSEQLDSLQRRNAYLEQLVRRTELVGELHAEAHQSARTAPEDFEELLSKIGELEFVDFTGDADVTLALDQHDPLGVWAGKAWKVLCALEDYARASSNGLCGTDVEGYLRSVPDGCRGYSANKHASTESEDVQKHPRFRAARRFPVPVIVAEDGCVEMMAHFKIAQSGLISPRLHYYDDTARSGKAYVGYIGAHLPTKRTN